MNIAAKKLVRTEHEGHIMKGFICGTEEETEDHYRSLDDITSVHLKYIHLAINRHHWKLNQKKPTDERFSFKPIIDPKSKEMAHSKFAKS